MTLGFLMMLGAAATGLVTGLMAAARLRALPSRTEPEFDETVAGRAFGYRVTMATGAALPVLMYAAINFAVGDLAATELF